MHTSSSANRTCNESRSASLYTATVRIPSSLQARMTRRAISPRFAIRIFRNMGCVVASSLPRMPSARSSPHAPTADGGTRRTPRANPRTFGGGTGGFGSGARLDPEQHLPVLDGLGVLDQDLAYDPVDFGLELVHQLHRLEDAERLALRHRRADLHVRRRVRSRRRVERPH